MSKGRPCIICGDIHYRNSAAKYCYPCYILIQDNLRGKDRNIDAERYANVIEIVKEIRLKEKARQ